MVLANPQPARQLKLDPEIARRVGGMLARGMSPQLVLAQLSQEIDRALVSAYINKAMTDPFIQGALANLPDGQATRANRVATQADRSVPNDDLEKRNWVLECYRRSWNNNPDSQTVPTLDNPDPETFLRDYYSQHRACLIRGWVDDWPALTLWNTDYFDEKVGRDTIVQVQKGRESRKNFEIEKVALRREIPFGEVSDHLRKEEASNDLYITANNGSSNRAAFDNLWTDFSDIEGITKAQPNNDGFLWIGPEGTITPFHHDLTHNLLIQVKGRKRAVMVPNWEEPRMRTRQRIFSDWSLEDLQAAPDDIRPQTVTVEWGPGEALFIPCGWWHHIVSLDESYSILLTNFVWPNHFVNPYMG